MSTQPDAATDSGSRPRVSIGGADVVRVVLGAILLIAAGLKAHQLSTEPVGNCGQLACRWIFIVELEIELVLGLWLVSGLGEYWARLMAGMCYSVFAGVALYKALMGDASCGCFGKVEVSPWYSMSLDIAAVAALLLFRRSGAGGRPARRQSLRLAMFAVTALAGGVAAAVPIVRYQPARLSADGSFTSDDASVLLEPTEWRRDRRLPLLGHIDIGGRLATGDWTLMLYRWRCRVCRREIQRLDEQARRLTDQGAAERFALVQLPPYAPPGKGPVPADSRFTLGRLTDARAWFVATPTVIRLRDGKVRTVHVIGE